MVNISTEGTEPLEIYAEMPVCLRLMRSTGTAMLISGDILAFLLRGNIDFS
jgi:hypothetical protein